MRAVAARQYGVITRSQLLIDVTVRTRAGRVKRKGLRVHRSGRLSPDEVTVQERIRVTTVARTLVGAFAADRLRDRRHRRAGFEVVRLTSDDLAYEAEIVADLERFLSRSRTSSKPSSRCSTSSASAR